MANQSLDQNILMALQKRFPTAHSKKIGIIARELKQSITDVQKTRRDISSKEVVQFIQSSSLIEEAFRAQLSEYTIERLFADIETTLTGGKEYSMTCASPTNSGRRVGPAAQVDASKKNNPTPQEIYKTSRPSGRSGTRTRGPVSG